MNEQNKTKASEDAYTTLLKFLEEMKDVFNMAILATPTGDVRTRFCDLNIRRMEFIAKGNAAALHSIRLHLVLDKLVIAEEALAEMCSDDSCLGDARYKQKELIKEFVKIMQE